MDNKLKELTDRLYDSGLAKGREDAERIVAEAQTKAEGIVRNAKAEAEAIISDAIRKANDVKKNSMTEIELAGKQAVARIKSDIEDVVVTKSLTENLSAVAADPKFIADMVLELAKNWHADASPADLKTVIPSSIAKEFEDRIKASTLKAVAEGIEVEKAEGMKSGFKIGERKGGYYIAFTDESFEALFRPYVREMVSKILFE